MVTSVLHCPAKPNLIMSAIPIIACRTCHSYRTKRVGYSNPNTTHYRCSNCGDEFDIDDYDAYGKEHPAQINRCTACDREGVELVEKSHRYSDQPDGEVVDFYRCTLCGREILEVIRHGDHVADG
ncbi:MAG: hypothetical protein JWP89_5374 [Schlesneria sp.]|nr:hypothetical protein [Schlesneria sp.]